MACGMHWEARRKQQFLNSRRKLENNKDNIQPCSPSVTLVESGDPEMGGHLFTPFADSRVYSEEMGTLVGPGRATGRGCEQMITSRGVKECSGPAMDRDEIEFSFYHVRPETAGAGWSTNPSSKQRPITAARTTTGGRCLSGRNTSGFGGIRDKGGFGSESARIVETNVDSDEKQSDQFSRWLQDDFLAHLEGKDRQVELHRMSTDERYLALLQKRFAQQQVKKARNNGFYMD
ncbi:uncharacterized protein LOC142340831 isoform X2 [Convolutriloba macropyga]|uniref:uncharacterized protein LOC142340831 isoform X2 n=1 Tax=Convolutriloba macropyga TaxID=536237 RepID=UPI003F522818